MKHTLLTVVAAGLAGSAAYAGSPEPYVEHVYMPPIEVETGSDWGGFYIGFLGGFQRGDVIDTVNDMNNDAEFTNYGGMAGYNFQSGKFVYGGEISAQFGSGTIAVTDVDIDYVVDARARVGYGMGKALIYGAGGYTTMAAPGGGTTLEVDGFNVGGGVEFAVTDNLFLGGEYIYRDLSGTAFGTDYDTNTHGIQIRAGYSF